MTATLTRAERRRQARQAPPPRDGVRIDLSRPLKTIVGEIIATSVLTGRVVIVHPDGERDIIEGAFYRSRDGMDTMARIVAVARQKAANDHR